MRVNVIGIGWYRQEHYDQLKEMFKDGDKLPDTYAQWLALAQNVCDKLTADGFEVVRAEISPDTFPEWCRTRGMEMDAKARAEYGSRCAQKDSEQRGSDLALKRRRRRRRS